jgi:pyridoxal phosphate enzyme (YggS family)
MTNFKLPNNVKLIAVSKTKSVADILQVYNQGLRDFGENYLQESLIKIPQLPADITWHFIGSIQSNKTFDIAKNFDIIHTIDREKIAKRFDNHANDLGKKLQVLIQVNIDNEESKSGASVKDLPSLVESVKKLKNIDLIGLMCIPQKNKNTAFVKMLELKNQFNLPELSMGMSGDYLDAIDNGSTMVRIGTAIFGERN